ncbi:MAG: hypothetical protein LM590_15290 [Thermofilum sp.]|nr:hypothetical protein [Thermofilum sp.]
MSLESFVDELHSIGFPEEVIEEVVQSLADLYVALRIPIKYVVKNPQPVLHLRGHEEN